MVRLGADARVPLAISSQLLLMEHNVGNLLVQIVLGAEDRRIGLVLLLVLRVG